MKSTMTLKLGVLAVLALSACAPNQSAQRSIASEGDGIVGGSAVSSADVVGKSTVELKAMVQERVLQNGKVVLAQGVATCTGTLISSNVVLTAGHCVEGIQSMKAVFALSEGAVNSGNAANVLRNVVKIILNKGFDLSKDKDADDIALLQLDKAAPAGYVPAVLLSNAASLKNGLQIVLAGYGATQADMSNNDVKGVGVLRQVSKPIEDASFSATEILFDQTNGTGSCHGDSGGPAYLKQAGKLVVVGVTSRGWAPEQDQSQAAQDDAENCKSHVVYTSVVAYVDWIQKKAIPAFNAMKVGSLKKL